MKLSNIHSLNQKWANIFLVSGDEPLLVEEALDTIRTAAAKRGYSERMKVTLDSLVSQTQCLSLFSTKRIAELDLTDIKLNAASSKLLQSYANEISPDTLLLIRVHKLDAKTEQSAWYKALDKVGIMIPIWPISLQQLPAWIIQRAKKLELTITTSAANLLAARVEGNLLAAAQELEKLRLLQNTNALTDAVIENTVTDHAHFDLFALVDSALAGDRSRSLRILSHLRSSDVEPILVLWALTRELRIQCDILKQMQEGASLSNLFPKFRIFEKRQPSVRAFLQRQKIDTCWKRLQEAAHIDRMLKGAELGNPWVELEKWVLLF